MTPHPTLPTDSGYSTEVIADIAEIKTDVKWLIKIMEDQQTSCVVCKKEIYKDITSLKKSRDRTSGAIVIVSAILTLIGVPLFIGWIRTFFNI